jgi:hypothetical protein
MIGVIGLLVGAATATYGWVTEHYWLALAASFLTLISCTAIDNLCKPLE